MTTASIQLHRLFVPCRAAAYLGAALLALSVALMSGCTVLLGAAAGGAAGYVAGSEASKDNK